MATTTNYSWTTPDDTDLVKDGAAAIRTLGTAIDTTVFTNAGAAVAKATVDAKGDLIAGTADNTVARLAVGANDTVLTADSSTATGLKWQAVAGGMTQLATGTFTGSSVTLSSISSAYQNLRLVVRNFKPSSDGDDLRMRLNAQSGTIYINAIWPNTSTSSRAFNDIDYAPVSPPQDNAAADALIVVDIPDYANTTTWKYWTTVAMANNSTTSTNLHYSLRFQAYNQTGAINEIELYCGGFTSGNYYLYGVK